MCDTASSPVKWETTAMSLRVSGGDRKLAVGQCSADGQQAVSSLEVAAISLIQLGPKERGVLPQVTERGKA